LRDIVATSEHLSTQERLLIAQVLDAADRPLREIMVPRLDVGALSVNLSVAEAMAAMRSRPFSRYPVVDGGLDDAVGFVHVRDLFTRPDDLDPRTPLRSVIRPIMRIPDSRRALPALAEMRRQGAHLALVVDEYGGAAGIVALEDLLEELVGDITDEFDPRRFGPEESSTPQGTDRPLPRDPVSAQLRLEEFAEQTGIDLPEGPYDTAAGWMLHALGRIPVEGDGASFGDIVVTVTQMRGRRVEEVRLDRADSAAHPPSDSLSPPDSR
jgi:putative hemolysin